MRIPLAFTDKGYFYPIGDNYYFVLVETCRLEGNRKYYCGTWQEFKDRFPYTVYPSGANCKYRSKTKHK